MELFRWCLLPEQAGGAGLLHLQVRLVALLGRSGPALSLPFAKCCCLS